MYIPVNLAFNIFDPINGADETLSPVLFLHGFGAAKESWDDIPQIIANRTKRKCYAYDARDHGDSDWTENFTFNILLDDLLYFMDSKDIKKAILIGHSMGGWTAQMVALRVPERFELLVLEEGIADVRAKTIIDASMAFMSMWQKAVQGIPKNTDESEAIRHAVDDVYSKVPPTQIIYFSEKERAYKQKIPMKQLQDGSYDVKHNVKQFEISSANLVANTLKPEGVYKGPVCVIYGSRSALRIGEKEDFIRQHCPNAELIPFEGATPNVHIDFPEKFVDTVINFLTKHLGSSRRYSF